MLPPDFPVYGDEISQNKLEVKFLVAELLHPSVATSALHVDNIPQLSLQILCASRGDEIVNLAAESLFRMHTCPSNKASHGPCLFLGF